MPAQKKKTKKTTSRGVLGKIESTLLALESPQPPPIPVEHLVAEGNVLVRLAAKVGTELRRVGVDAKMLASLGDRTAALSEAQTALALVRRKRRTTKEVDLESKGVELRSVMVADSRFALRDDSDAQETLDRIQEGEGLDDLVQNLRDLAAFATRYKSALTKVGAKPEPKTKLATKLASDLESVLADRRTGDAEETKALDMRDRAATYLLAAMREVRAAGAYAFRDKPEIAGRFRGAYDAKRRARSKTNKANAAKAKANGQTTPPATTATPA